MRLHDLKKEFKKAKKTVSDTRNFFDTGIWHVDIKKISSGRAFFVKRMRILLLAIRGFKEDRCQLRASALTFYSLLSIVPLLALFFGIAKGFGLEKLLENVLRKNFSEYEEALTLFLNFSHSLLEKTSGGLIAGTGVVLLLWSIMKLLTNIEVSFNHIWKVKKTRSIYRKFSDYISILLFALLLLVISNSIVIFVSTKFTAFLGTFGSIVFQLMRLLPFVLIWILFTTIYVLMPNTKVSFRSGFLAGLIAGTIYQIAQFAYISLQIGVARFNAIYGSFAALPLFLVWLQLSWIIVLFGTEISYAIENASSMEFNLNFRDLSASNKKLLSLLKAQVVIKNFSEGKEPLTAPQLKNTLRIPAPMLHLLLDELVESKILSESAVHEQEEPAYLPFHDINDLTVGYVISALEKRGDSLDAAYFHSKELIKLSKTLETFNDLIEKSPTNKLLKDL
jgi:membrane protein